MSDIKSLFTLNKLLLLIFSTCLFFHIKIIKAEESKDQNPLKRGDTYFKEAESYFNLKDYRSAIPFYEKSSESYDKAGKKYLSAYNYRRIGKCYILLREYRKAISNYEKAIKINKEIENIDEEQICHFELGSAYFESKKIVEAKEQFQKSFELNKKLAENKRALSDMTMIAKCFTLLDDYKSAKQFLDEALELSRAYGDWPATTDIIAELSKVYLKEGAFKKSLDILDNGLKINIKVGNKLGVARVTSDMANIYILLGNPNKSLDLLFQAKKIYKDEREPSSGARTIYKIANIYEENRDFDNALKYYDESITEFERLSDNESIILSKISKIRVRIFLGEIDEANSALSEISAKEIEDSSIYNKIFYYKTYGLFKMKIHDLDSAKSFFIRGADSARQILDKVNIAENLLLSAKVHINEGFYEKAHESLVEALKNVDNTDALTIKATIYSEIGFALGKLKNYKDSIDYIKKGISWAEKISAKHLLLSAQINLGFVLTEVGSYEEANSAFTVANKIWEELGFHKGRWEVFYGISRIFVAQNKTFEALAYLENSIDLLDDIDFEESSCLIDEKEQIYVDIIDILLSLYEKEKEQKYLRKAYYYAELKKTEDFKRLFIDSKIAILNTVERDTSEKFSRYQKEKEQNSIRLLCKLLPQSKRNDIKSTLIQNEKDILELKSNIAKENPLFKMLYLPEPAELSSIQKILRAKSAMVEYVLGENTSYLFLFYPKGLKVIKLKGYNILEGLIKSYIRNLNSPLTKKNLKEHWEIGKELNKILLSPIYPLLGSIKNIVIVPDKKIFNLPFEALIKEGEKINFLSSIDYLVKRYNFYYLPSATFVKLLTETNKRKGNTILIMGDPNYNRIVEDGITLKSNLENSGFDLTSGIDTRSEIESIKRLYKGDGLFVNRGENSQKEIFSKLNLNNYNVIHFALKTFIPDRINERLVPAFFFSNPNSSGLLTTAELLKLNINSSLLFFSQSSIKPWGDTNCDGTLLFVLSLLQQKTESLIHTMWDPFKLYNSRFIEFFYEEYFKKQNAGLSLNSSQNKLIKSRIEINPGSGFDEDLAFTTHQSEGKSKIYVSGAHPYFWANYRVYGLPD